MSLEPSRRLETDASLIVMVEGVKLLTPADRCCTADAVKGFAGLEAQQVVFEELMISKKSVLMVLMAGCSKPHW